LHYTIISDKFAHKISDKFYDIQKMEEKTSNLDICAYYRQLSKRDKGNLVQFLIKRYDMNYSTINAKLNGRSKMTVLEHDMITNVIDNELWKM